MENDKEKNPSEKENWRLTGGVVVAWTGKGGEYRLFFRVVGFGN